MKKVKTESVSKPRRPGLTPESRENQLISLAVDLAEEQLRNGTASSQVISHFLKLGSTEERSKREVRELEKQLLVAKTEALKSQKRSEELFAEAIKAFKSYSGGSDSDYE